MTRSAATEVAVFDRRKNIRKRVEYAGSIQRTRGRRDLCVIWDISDKGAQLVVPAAKNIPDKFVLVITRKKQERFYCRVMWRTECQVGVAFQEN